MNLQVHGILFLIGCSVSTFSWRKVVKKQKKEVLSEKASKLQRWWSLSLLSETAPIGDESEEEVSKEK